MHDTHVVHVTDNIPDAVYIGRANGRARLAASPFANPFPLAMGDRDTVLLRYRDYLRSSSVACQSFAGFPSCGASRWPAGADTRLRSARPAMPAMAM